MRQEDNTQFIGLLNNLRFAIVTTLLIEILGEQRRVPLAGEFEKGAAVRILPTVKLMDEYNIKIIDKLTKLIHMYIINSLHKSWEVTTYGERPLANVTAKNINNSRGFLYIIT